MTDSEAINRSDPSPLTTAQILREIAAVKELFGQRMEAVEKAVAVAHDDLTRVPTETMKAIAALNDVIGAKLLIHEEKFEGIEKQFTERDTRFDAALLAAEKAVGKQQESNDKATQKSDLSFTKQIDQQGALMLSIKSELDSRINDVKDRFTTFQATELGKGQQKDDRRSDTSLWVAIGGLVMGVVLGAMGFLIAK